MKLIKKLRDRINAYWTGFFYGLKDTNDTVFTQAGINNSVGTEIQQQVTENRVSKDLLKGEVTQQVEELRYRTYKVDRESKQFEYFSPTKAIRFDKQDSKFVKYDNSDNLELITIQPNHANTANIYDGTKDVDFLNAKLVDGQGNVSINLGHFDVENKYNIEIERDFMPRFKLEAYTTRLVVKKLDDEDNMILDFYVSKYPQEKDMKSIYFIKEVEKLMSGYKQSDITSMIRVSFVTSHAYGLNDMIEFRFDHIYYKGILEYDGHYILKFKAHAYVNGKDQTDEFYSKSMDEKYRNNEKKEVVLDAFSGGNEYKTFVCAECGKTVEYDTEAIDNMQASLGRDITDDDISDDNGVMSYMDLQISEQTFGKKLCSDCLKKYLNNMNKQE
jgi:hypothetical protein